VYLSRPLRFDFLGAALIIIEPACAAARAEGARKSLRNMWAGLFFVWTEKQRIVVLRTVTDPAIGGIPCGEPPPEVTIPPDQEPASPR